MGIFRSKKKESGTRKYNADNVRLVIERIVQDTVNRDVLRQIVDNNLREILGDKYVDTVYMKLNLKDSKVDQDRVEQCIRAIEDLES